ncbi:unnamed protein product [Prorocentrum cordatum]|uniref:SRP54-type proteins GTP-binding domain-containing protein n=1 Tax=Prorocentrum cordatum TaxID=2364126 RepID=A0ABN9T1A4_9DINO|nr:unnamed protein product [Polarella glacialis]
MIDAFYIFTKGGLLLWSSQLVKVAGNPLDRLIREVLLEDRRMGESQHQCDSYKMSWKLENTLDLFFVVVYQSILPITYLEGLLTSASKEFIKTVDETMGGFGNGLQVKHVPFDAQFRRIREKVDKEQQALRKKGTAMRSFSDTKKGQEVAKVREEKGLSAGAPKKKTKGGNDEDDDEDDGDNEDAAGSGPRPQAKAKGVPAFKKKDAAADVDPEKPKKGKEARKWSDSKVTKESMDSLDFSKNKDMKESAEADRMKAEFIGDGEDDFMNEDDIESLDDGSDDGEDAAEANGKDSGKPAGRMDGLFKSLTRSVKNVTGGAVLSEEDLAPVLHQFKSDLMSKNVAAEVSNKLADSVRTAIVGKKTERFTSIAKTVKEALKESIETLLTPKKSVDVLRAAMAAKNAGRVYVIVFLGVNGVGKSTNLAKVAYYLKNKGGLDVLICACDTFRAGAVEQLKTHARCLDVPLFERGYGKDPAEIAKSAIQHARNNGHEVVLVDTAGRMQDNEPLMRALAKLVAINNPDLVLFVGEALVGNDAIDQVSKFNRSLIDMSESRRGIDGMLLTKYDTVDDKVGAALSMVYVTGQPVVFVGTGQKYTHLRKMQAKEVARTLLG